MRIPKIKTEDLLQGIVDAANAVARARVALAVAAVNWDVATAANQWTACSAEGADREAAARDEWSRRDKERTAAEEKLDAAERKLYVETHARLKEDNLKAAEEAARETREYLAREAV